MIRRYPRLCVFAYECFVFLGRVTNPSAKPLILEDQFVSLILASLLRPVRLGRPYQEHKAPSGIARKVIDSRNTPSTTNLEEEEIVDAPGNNGNASMPVQVKRPNPWRKMMMMMMMMMNYLIYLNNAKLMHVAVWFLNPYRTNVENRVSS